MSECILKIMTGKEDGSCNPLINSSYKDSQLLPRRLWGGTDFVFTCTLFKLYDITLNSLCNHLLILYVTTLTYTLHISGK